MSDNNKIITVRRILIKIDDFLLDEDERPLNKKEFLALTASWEDTPENKKNITVEQYMERFITPVMLCLKENIVNDIKQELDHINQES